MTIQLVDLSEITLLLGIAETATDEQRAIASFCMTAAVGAVKRHLRYDPVYASRVEYYPQMDVGQFGGQSVWEVSDTQAYERRVSQSSSSALQLKHIPIRSITSLRIDYDGRAGTRSGAFGSETVKTEGEDFWANYDSVDSDGNKVCLDGMLRSQGLWPQNPGSVKVEYYAGYKAAELRGQDSVIDASPIWDACCDETTRRFLKVMSRKKNPLAGFVGPLTSERLGDYSYSSNAEVMRTILGGTDVMPETIEKLNDYLNYGIFL